MHERNKLVGLERKGVRLHLFFSPCASSDLFDSSSFSRKNFYSVVLSSVVGGGGLVCVVWLLFLNSTFQLHSDKKHFCRVCKFVHFFLSLSPVLTCLGGISIKKYLY